MCVWKPFCLRAYMVSQHTSHLVTAVLFPFTTAWQYIYITNAMLIHTCVMSCACHNSVICFCCDVIGLQIFHFQHPSPTLFKVVGRFHGQYISLKANVLLQTEMLGIHDEILVAFGVVHEIRKLCRNWVVTVTHHLFGGVDYSRFWNRTAFIRVFRGVAPQAPNKARSFDAHRLQTFFYTWFNGHQTATSRSYYCYLFCHGY